jgi:hypothetical protein
MLRATKQTSGETATETTTAFEAAGSAVSRRGFLRRSAMGAGAAAIGGTGTVWTGLTAAAFGESASAASNFGRMFPSLPPFATASDALARALIDIGKPGGILDARDNLAAGPVQLIVDPALSVNNPDNPTHTAGTTFFGQFLDHDCTLDRTSRLGIPADPRTSPNGRTPAFDLDSVYGGGPTASPELYNSADRAKLKIESGGLFEDVPRQPTGAAIIGDGRNDENLIIGGLQAAFLAFHNQVVDHVRAQRKTAPGAVFAEARKLVTWHYHWLILTEFLPQILDRAVIEDILRHGRRFYRPSGGTFIPVEFQGAAYRFGHSMVRPSYRANLAGDNGQAFFGFIFDPAGQGQADPVDFRGGARAPRRFIGWQTFFDFGDGEVRRNKIIDTKLSTPLFNLPLGTLGDGQPPTSLATRNLLRHVTWSQPSGQAIAKAVGAPVLAKRDFADLAPYNLGLDTSTPLWFYVLREAAVQKGGRTLGTVGSRIVGEVFAGLLQLDAGSWIRTKPSWRPTLPDRSGRVTGRFRMVDLLTFARVDPASRGQ